MDETGSSSDVETFGDCAGQGRGSSLPLLPVASVCESCGGQFECGARLNGCWCAEVELSEATREELRSRFRGCLCRSCLARFAEGRGGSF